MRTIRILAKCGNQFLAQLRENNVLKAEYDGHVPNFLQKHDAYHIDLEINLATGQILNWKEPSLMDLIETFRP